jgi:hypothetical protein
MVILLTVLLLFLTALALSILRWTRPGFRYHWLVASGGGLLAWLSVFFWQGRMPIVLAEASWQPVGLPAIPFSFLADGLSWPYAFCLTTLAMSVILTTLGRSETPSALTWISTLTLTGLGLLAVLAETPLALVVAWSAIDLFELIAHLRAVDEPSLSEDVVVAFAARLTGSGVLLWANMVSLSAGVPLNFQDAAPGAGLYLLLAAGLRLGVLPLHLPFSRESVLRRDFGTVLRLVSSASSLVLLTRIPSASLASPFTPLLMLLAVLAALYGAWLWMRAPDELIARPFWQIGMAALAVAAALRSNPQGTTGWGISLLLGGSALFISTIQQPWLRRILLACALGASALPFTASASGWMGSGQGIFLPFLLIAQAMLLAGFVRHALRPAPNPFTSLPLWGQALYVPGLVVLPLAHLLLGLWGWPGARSWEMWWPGLVASLLAVALTWLGRRLVFFNPVRAHWVRPAERSWLDWLYRSILRIYQSTGRLTSAITSALEGDGGFLWTLLFLAIFISLLAGGTR